MGAFSFHPKNAQFMWFSMKQARRVLLSLMALGKKFCCMIFAEKFNSDGVAFKVNVLTNLGLSPQRKDQSPYKLVWRSLG